MADFNTTSEALSSEYQKVIPPVPFRGEYSQEAADSRRKWVESNTNTSLDTFDGWWEPNAKFEKKHLFGNIENAIGVVRIPVGVIGPITIRGKHADGTFLVPAATTEGALLASACRGSSLLNKAGGVEAVAFRQRMSRAPTIICENGLQAESLGGWIQKSVPLLHNVVASVSKRAKLLSVDLIPDDDKLHVIFAYETGEAAGQNMSSSCTSACYQWIKTRAKEDLPGVNITWILEENTLSGDKRPTSLNALYGRGVSVVAKASVPEDLIQSVLKVSSEKLLAAADITKDLSLRAGTPFNCLGNVPNIAAAVFAAMGQDLGSVGECSQGFLSLRKNPQGGLDVTLKMPTLVVGTVGGGTRLPTQRQGLEMIGCVGPKSNFKLSEIIASVCMAGDLSLLASVASGTHSQSHDILGRNRIEAKIK